jgi:hypothetical protein
MTGRPSLFSQEELTSLLTELGERLARRGVRLSGYVIGGFAMTREVSARRLTEDLDGLFTEYAVARAEAEALAREKGISPSWFSDSASSFVEFDPADDIEATEMTIGDARVRIASPRFLLAMKLAAGRAKDTGDLIALVRHLDLHDPERIVDIAFAVYGDDSVTLSDSRESVFYQAADLIRQAYPE